MAGEAAEIIAPALYRARRGDTTLGRAAPSSRSKKQGRSRSLAPSRGDGAGLRRRRGQRRQAMAGHEDRRLFLKKYWRQLSEGFGGLLLAELAKQRHVPHAVDRKTMLAHVRVNAKNTVRSEQHVRRHDRRGGLRRHEYVSETGGPECGSKRGVL